MKTPTLTPTLTLPEELMVEILLRLPVRSLLRFKCVCKSWRSLISDPQFAKSHFDLAAAPTHRLLLPTKTVIESLDLDASLQDDSALVRMDIKVQHTGSIFHDIIWGSCRGFILIAEADHHRIYVWNPSTGTRRQLPLSRMQILGDGFFLIGNGIGYDESRDDYLVVLLGLDRHKCGGNYTHWLPQVEVFSLKTNTSYFICGSTGSEFVYKRLASKLSDGLFLNHSLHWLVNSWNKPTVILAFNLIDRSLSEILLPPKTASTKNKYLNIIEGCLSLCIFSQGQFPSRHTIWVMKEYKVHSSWTKSFVLSLDNYPYNSFFPICFSKGVGLLGSNLCGRLVKFNDKGELIESCACRACHRKYGVLLDYSNIYRESLLSLPGDFAEDDEESTKDEESTEDEEVGEGEELTGGSS